MHPTNPIVVISLLIFDMTTLCQTTNQPTKVQLFFEIHKNVYIFLRKFVNMIDFLYLCGVNMFFLVK